MCRFNGWFNSCLVWLLVHLFLFSFFANGYFVIHIIVFRHDYNFKLKGKSILEEIDEIYRQSSYLKLWSVVRYSAALLGKVVDSLAPSITTMLVSGRQVRLFRCFFLPIFILMSI